MGDAAVAGEVAGAAVELPPLYQPVRETRFAVVMYGGVSLAVYINGVAQELLRLVRATAPHRPPGEPLGEQTLAGRALLREEELRGSEKVYRRLGQLVGRELTEDESDPMRAGVPRPEDPIRTRFVVDILSGSSAGGINAIFLGKALATGKGIDALRELWMREADVEALLNDNQSEPSDELPVAGEPESLFNSQRMYWQLLSALDGVDGQKSAFASESSPFVDELDVWLTATDLQGLLLPIELSDRAVYELRYRNVFRFRYATRHATGAETREFDRWVNPFLAFAARCTASFPFAFEPMQLADIDPVIACQPFGWYQENGLTSTSNRWRRFFRDYIPVDAAEDSSEGLETYRERSFADGGYLDNKPFTWATGTLKRRRRDLAVDRKLLYIEPDPGSTAAVPKTATQSQAAPPAQPTVWPRRPDAVANIQAATIALPRKESIRDDLNDLLARNRACDELQRIRTAVEASTADLLPPFRQFPRDQWRTLSAKQLVEERGVVYGAYHRLKITQLTADIGRIASSALGFDDDSDEHEAIVSLVRVWIADRYPETGTGENSQNELMLRLDIGYRVRRLNFLLDRTTRLLSLDADARAVISKLGPVPDDPAWRNAFRDTLFLLRTVLGDALILLRSQARLLASPSDDNPIQAQIKALNIKSDVVARLLSTTDIEAQLTAAGAAMDALADALTEALKPVLVGTRSAIESFLQVAPSTDTPPMAAPDNGDAPAAGSAGSEARQHPAARPAEAEGVSPAAAAERLALAVMRHYWQVYETYDAILFPVSFGVVGESDRVDVVRISPADATSLVDEHATGKRKLGGIAFGHFGGFFDERWRRNDFMWGRLDAAERLITTLLDPSPVRDQLLHDAQLAILADEFDTDTREQLTDLLVQGLLDRRDATRTSEANAVSNLSPDELRQVFAAASTPEAILAHLKSGFEVDRELDATRMVTLTGRTMTVAGKVFDGISERRQAAGPVSAGARWISRIGRLTTGIVALATGRDFLPTLARNAFAIPVLAAVLLVAVGLVFNSPATSHAGWLIGTAAIALWLVNGIVREILRSWPPTNRHTILVIALRVAAIVALIALAFAALHWWLPADSDSSREQASLTGGPDYA